MSRRLLRLLSLTILLLALALVLGDEASAQGGEAALHLPQVFQNFEPTGTVGGQVTAARTGLPVESAVVCLAGTTACTLTDDLGAYTLPGVPIGNQTLAAGAFGYFSTEAETTVLWEQDSNLDFTLDASIATGRIRIELTWATQKDLDAHLWLPEIIPVHIAWDNLGYCPDVPYACLDKDDFAYGPENIEIRQRFPGTYVYAVYIFDTGSLVNSAPVVRIYDDTGLLAERRIPLQGEGRWWHVFDLDGITGNILPVDSVSNTSPGPYDPRPDRVTPFLQTRSKP